MGKCWLLAWFRHVSFTHDDVQSAEGRVLEHVELSSVRHRFQFLHQSLWLPVEDIHKVLQNLEVEGGSQELPTGSPFWAWKIICVDNCPSAAYFVRLIAKRSFSSLWNLCPKRIKSTPKKKSFSKLQKIQKVYQISMWFYTPIQNAPTSMDWLSLRAEKRICCKVSLISSASHT